MNTDDESTACSKFVRVWSGSKSNGCEIIMLILWDILPFTNPVILQTIAIVLPGFHLRDNGENLLLKSRSKGMA